jgi:hypothetical protein
METSQEAAESLKRGTKKSQNFSKRSGSGREMQEEKQWPVGDKNLANFSNRL